MYGVFRTDGEGIASFHSEARAQEEVERLGTGFYYEVYVPQCIFGWLTGHRCPDEASWFVPNASNGEAAICDKHYEMVWRRGFRALGQSLLHGDVLKVLGR